MGLEPRNKMIQDFLCDLSEELGSEWKNIGRRLGLGDPILENIENDFSTQLERGLQMLRRWWQLNGVNGLEKKLDDGLRKAKRIDLADQFVPLLNHIVSSMPRSISSTTAIPNEMEEVMIDKLKGYYIKRNKVPMVPWAGRNGKVLTVGIDTVYTNLELLIDIDSPDLPLRYSLKLDKLFEEVRAEDMNEEGESPGDRGGRLAVSSCRVVARGRTGSGKTTLLLKMSSDWADRRTGPLKDAKAVFLLPLRKLDHRSNLGDAIVNHLLPLSTFTPQFIERFINNNQKVVVVLLDGYDEFKGKGLHQKDCGNIVKMLRNEYLPDVRVFITTRPGRVGDFFNLEDDITDEYRHLQITGFSSSDIDVYVKKILSGRQHLAEKLLNYLEENHLKTELASLPLMCCAFCQLTKFTNGKDFKDMNTISTLFDKLIQCLLKYHPKSKAQRSTPASDEDSIAREVSIDLLPELGKVALMGFFRSQEEELIFSRKDFQNCRPGPDKVIAQGCKSGILYQDGEAEYRPTEYEELEINNEGSEDSARSFSFVLKIFQEKLAGRYLAHLSNGNEEEQRLFQTHVQSIASVQRATDLGNVLMFACGASIQAARVIIKQVVHLLRPEAGKIVDFMNGKLHFSECQHIQRLIEFCLQLNYESQSKGQLNDILKELLSGTSRLRLVGISSYATKSLGYLLEHSAGLSIESLELIRLHLNSSTEFREFLNTFPGLEDAVSTSMNKKRRPKKAEKAESLTKEKREEKLLEGMPRSHKLPKYLLQRSDDVFRTVTPLWQHVSKMQMSEWNFRPVIDGLKHCPVKELILNGLKADEDDWNSLFSIIVDPSFNSLQKLTLGMTGLKDEQLANLVPAIMSQVDLNYLKLSGNEVGLDFLETFSTNVPMPKLETLILDKTDMDGEAIEVLADTLPCFPALRSLDVRRNNGSDDLSIGSLLDNLHHCQNLERLMISLYAVTKTGLEKLTIDVVGNLKELHLVHTPIPDTVIQCATDLLPRMTSLEALMISGTPPDKSNPKVTLGGKASSDTAHQFSETLARTPSLRFVSILYTTFDDDSFLYLLQRCTEAHAQYGPKWTLRFSSACIPQGDTMRRPVREAESKFLRIWV